MKISAIVTFMVAAAMLCGIAQAAPPTLTLGAPWLKVPPPDDALLEWTIPGPDDGAAKTSQYVEIIRIDLPEGGFGEFVAKRQLSVSNSPGFTKAVFRKMDDCTRPAWTFSYNETTDGVPHAFVWVLFSTSSYIYETVYLRPIDQPENAAALAAVMAFCNN